MNNVSLIGRLTKDPELRVNPNTQNSVCTFTLAVDREFKKEGQPTADFLNITCFGKQAENLSKYKRKGEQLAVIGRIETGSYENKNGDKVYYTGIMANRVEFIGNKSEDFRDAKGAESSNDIDNMVNRAVKTSQEVLEGYEVVDEDDVPF